MPLAVVGLGASLIATLITSAFATYVLVGIDEIGLESKFIFSVHSHFCFLVWLLNAVSLSVEHPFPLMPMQAMAKAVQSQVENQIKMIRVMPILSR